MAKKGNSNLLVGIDIGTSKVAVIVGEVRDDGSMEIVGHGEALQNSKLWAKVVRRSADARVGELEAGLAGPSGGGVGGG